MLPEAKRDRWVKAQSGDIGARPLEKISVQDHGIIRSHLQWDNREQSLEWVRQQLTGVTTFAVDGSQVFPQKDFSIPIALVQIGWFENHHSAAGTYEKDILLDVMTPKDLVADRSQPMDRWINMRRFSMEVQRLIDYIKTAKGQSARAGPRPRKVSSLLRWFASALFCLYARREYSCALRRAGADAVTGKRKASGAASRLCRYR